MENRSGMNATRERIVIDRCLSSERATAAASNFWLSPSLHCAFLIALVMLCYGNTMGSYFLADDATQVADMATALTNPHAIGEHLWGSFGRVPGFLAWRPGLFVSFFIDFLIWKTNPVGYFITNLAFLVGSVLLIYAIVHTLTMQWSQARASASALLAAASFALNPLRCGSVSWIVGRVDIVCGFFYLLSILLLLRLLVGQRSIASRQTLWLFTGSAISYAVALSVKEMPITLPIVITLAAALYRDTFRVPVSHLMAAAGGARKETDADTWMSRHAIVLAFWSIAGAYYALRYFALGTWTGGYATADAGLLQPLIEKWSSSYTILRLFFPLPHDLFGGQPILLDILFWLYVVLFFVASVRNCLFNRIDWRFVTVMVAWVGSAALPVYQLWSLGPNLEGSRYFWFISIPLSLLLPIALFRPLPVAAESLPGKKFDAAIVSMGVAALACFLIVLGVTAHRTSTQWVMAGQEVREFSRACVQLAEKFAPDEKIVLFGIPKIRTGAYMILNMHTFNHLLMQPLCSGPIASRFAVFEPVLFSRSAEDFVDPNRLKEYLNDRKCKGPFVWCGAERRFIPLNLFPPPASKTPPPGSEILKSARLWTGSNGGQNVLFDNLFVNPSGFDFLVLTLHSRSADSKGGVVRVFWSGTTTMPEREAALQRSRAETYIRPQSAATDRFAKHVTVRVPLSHFQRWFYFQTISQIVVQLPAGLSLERAELMPNGKLAPVLEIRNRVSALHPSCDNGVYSVQPQTKISLRVRNLCDHAERVCIAISKPNNFFDDFRANPDQVNLMTLESDAGPFIEIDTAKLSPGLYQLRARAELGDGTVTEFSEPATVWLW